MGISVPAAPWGRIIRRCRIVRRSGWVVAAVVAVRVIIPVIVGVREHRAEREGSEPDPDTGSGAERMRGPCRRRDGHAATGFPKQPTNHIHLRSLQLGAAKKAGSRICDIRKNRRTTLQV